MRKALIAVLALMFLLPVGCSSPDLQLIPPRFRVRLPAGQIVTISGAATITILIDIYNDSNEEIVLKRLQLQSRSTSNFLFRSHVRVHQERIPPGGVATVDMIIDGRFLDRDSGLGSAVRGRAFFESEFGGFSHPIFEQVLEHGRDQIEGEEN